MVRHEKQQAVLDNLFIDITTDIHNLIPFYKLKRLILPINIILQRYFVLTFIKLVVSILDNMSPKRMKKNPKDELNAMKKILCDGAKNQMKVQNFNKALFGLNQM
ncbi:CLUMA_CG021218, isoform A [Clunio marinus]|uniref:CLUMA_CG021218, isoform A n=1 Tax=Clunio marinus TaxID=568069 RepID=A0A1J1J6S3_9DIPT|nr:CLUMA_CG021218, isoform A [Clunio marinus]